MTLTLTRPLLLLALVLGVLLGVPCVGAAADLPSELIKRLSVRVSGGVAFFLSKDQLDWLGFQRPGFLADLGFSVEVLPWLSAELGGTIGIFMAGEKAAELAPLVPIVAAPGGLLAPWLGVRAHGTGRRLIPYLGLNFGPGFTGDLVRPVLQASIGADIKVGAGASIGPVVGLSQVRAAPAARRLPLCPASACRGLERGRRGRDRARGRTSRARVRAYPRGPSWHARAA